MRDEAPRRDARDMPRDSARTASRAGTVSRMRRARHRAGLLREGVLKKAEKATGGSRWQRRKLSQNTRLNYYWEASEPKCTCRKTPEIGSPTEFSKTEKRSEQSRLGAGRSFGNLIVTNAVVGLLGEAGANSRLAWKKGGREAAS